MQIVVTMIVSSFSLQACWLDVGWFLPRYTYLLVNKDAPTYIQSEEVISGILFFVHPLLGLIYVLMNYFHELRRNLFDQIKTYFYTIRIIKMEEGTS